MKIMPLENESFACIRLLLVNKSVTAPTFSYRIPVPKRKFANHKILDVLEFVPPNCTNVKNAEEKNTEYVYY